MENTVKILEDLKAEYLQKWTDEHGYVLKRQYADDVTAIGRALRLLKTKLGKI